MNIDRHAVRKWLLGRLTALADAALSWTALLAAVWLMRGLLPPDVRAALRALLEAIIAWAAA